MKMSFVYFRNTISGVDDYFFFQPTIFHALALGVWACCQQIQLKETNWPTIDAYYEPTFDILMGSGQNNTKSQINREGERLQRRLEIPFYDSKIII